jgi:hypothetical protein
MGSSENHSGPVTPPRESPQPRPQRTPTPGIPSFFSTQKPLEYGSSGFCMWGWEWGSQCFAKKMHLAFYCIGKVTDMYCHCNNLLVLKYYNKVYLVHLRTLLLAGCKWVTPVILATQEAEIRRIMV